MCPVTTINYVHMYIIDECRPQHDEFVQFVCVCVYIAIFSDVLLLLRYYITLY